MQHLVELFELQLSVPAGLLEALKLQQESGSLEAWLLLADLVLQSAVWLLLADLAVALELQLADSLEA